MGFPDGQAFGKCVPEFAFGMGRSFPLRCFAESASHSGRSKWDTLSQRRSNGKLRPIIRSRNGMHGTSDVFPDHVPALCRMAPLLAILPNGLHPSSFLSLPSLYHSRYSPSSRETRRTARRSVPALEEVAFERAEEPLGARLSGLRALLHMERLTPGPHASRHSRPCRRRRCRCAP